ncbi:MAG TPA: hypothetical protein VFP84_26080 [Kofleriaceae bacterium]|nr:hypothetical protein [Kofleriaceae bacterium]
MQPGAQEQPVAASQPSAAAPAAAGRPAPRTPSLAVDKPLASVETPIMDDEVLDAIVKKDPLLAKFMKHYKAVLPDKQGLEDYHKLLSDPAMMKAMADELMDPGKGHPASEEYYHRLMVVDYFAAGLDWKDNPQREKLIETTQAVITKDNFEPGQDDARKQVLGGTKMELYRKLASQEPEKAQALVAQAQGTRMEKMVNWMAQEDSHRSVREKEIMKEADDMARGN